MTPLHDAAHRADGHHGSHGNSHATRSSRRARARQRVFEPYEVRKEHFLYCNVPDLMGCRLCSLFVYR